MHGGQCKEMILGKIIKGCDGRYGNGGCGCGGILGVEEVGGRFLKFYISDQKNA